MKRDIGTDRGGKPAGEEQVRQAAATSAEQGLQECWERRKHIPGG